MDNFAEQLVVKHPTSSDRAKKMIIFVGGCLMTVLLILVSVMMLGSGSFIPVLGLLLAAGTGYGIYFFMQETYVEYEYTFTNGELDIDKIIAKKKRISLLSVDVRKFTAFGKNTEAGEETADMTVIIGSDNIASHEYYADFDHDEYGSSRLIFAPDERMLENIKKTLPASLRSGR